ncbi:glycosyltransferase [Pelagicoccus sp. SDUM812002]|uniref:glycosyltransferase n=1 Tax=Pelagicoccus sp. SDUM812002 TaxID=3041266 RepID=UPI00280EF0B8|nr:glycosyltransferase [Pelagicoccus sp. SDUM812002]MDQ8188162.1 glycosyltransferase [Pelagicoccus sp. SDUM812002]
MIAEGVKLLDPLVSTTPTGMGVASGGVFSMFDVETDDTLHIILKNINGCRNGTIRFVLRFMLLQVSALFFLRKTVVILSHHGFLLPFIKQVVVVHDFISLENPKQHKMQTLYFRYVLPIVLKNCVKIVVISDDVKRKLLRHYAWCDSRKIFVIPSVSKRVDDYLIMPRSRLDEKLAFGRLLVVGARYLHKRLDFALATLKILRKDRGLNVKLTVVSVDKTLWRGFSGYDLLEDSEVSLGFDYASEEELLDCYTQASFLLHFSSAEGFGLPPIEAMALGVPVLSADYRIARETCGDGALYFDPSSPSKVADFIEQAFLGRFRSELENVIDCGDSRALELGIQKAREKWVALFRGL